VYNPARYCVTKNLTTYFLLLVAFLFVLPISTKKECGAIAAPEWMGRYRKIP